MAMLNRLKLRLRALFFKSIMEEELDAEVRFHLEREIEENLARGMTSEEARYAAIRSFGGVERVKEESRDVRGIRLLEELWQDLRYAARMLVKNPGFTLIAVLTLALGIGAVTAIFSVVNAVLLRPLPYKEADRLVMVRSYNQSRGFNADPVSPLDFADWRSQSHVFERMAASTDAMYTLTGAGEPVPIIAYQFSADYFPVLGVAPLLGRTFLPEEEQ